MCLCQCLWERKAFFCFGILGFHVSGCFGLLGVSGQLRAICGTLPGHRLGRLCVPWRVSSCHHTALRAADTECTWCVAGGVSRKQRYALMRDIVDVVWVVRWGGWVTTLYPANCAVKICHDDRNGGNYGVDTCVFGRCWKEVSSFFLV